MSVSPHDFPTPEARDADPNAIPLGPQAPTVHQTLGDELEQFEGVQSAIPQQTRPLDYGPIEIVITESSSGEDTGTETSTGAESVLSAVRHEAQRVLGDAFITGCSNTPHGRNAAVPPDEPIVGSVVIWRHPLHPHIEHVLEQHGAVYDFTCVWDETPASLSIDPGTTQWGGTKPLYVEFSGPVDSIDTVTRTVADRIISTVPRPSITQLQTYNTSDEVPDDAPIQATRVDATGTQLLAVSFTDRKVSHLPGTGVYNLPADALPTIAEQLTDDSSVIVGATDSCVDVNASVSEGAQLTITSPPYLDVIDYDAYDTVAGDWSRKHGASIDDATTSSSTSELVELWKAQQREVFEQVYDITRDGGYCAVVIGHVKLDDGKWIPLPHEFSSVMRDVGWEFHERIIWRKVGNRDSRFGTTIQHPKPTYYYPNQVHEEIMIWRKGDIDRRKEPDASLEMSELMKREVSNNVWHIPPVPHNKNVEHPCPFPEELVHRLTTLFTYPGDLVVDPMAGSGTTVKVADRLERVAIGTELQSRFTAEARRRLSAEAYSRNDQIIPSFEDVVDGESSDASLIAFTPDDESEATASDESRVGHVNSPDGHTDLETTQSSLPGFSDD